MTARRARTPEPGDIGVQVTAGDLSGNDYGRLVELDYAWTAESPEQHIAGTLARLRVDSLGVVLRVEGDPQWPAVEGIAVTPDHPVTLGPHPEASGR